MTRSTLIFAPFAVTLLLGGCATPSGQVELAKDVVCVQTAKLSLQDAVAVAEKSGGRAIGAHYRQDEELGCLTNKPGHYYVTLVSNGTPREVAVNADVPVASAPPAPESILEGASEALDRIFEPDPTQGVALARNARLTLPEAVTIAEQSAPGDSKAIRAHIEEKNGRLGYAVNLVEHGKVHSEWVDAGPAFPAVAQR